MAKKAALIARKAKSRRSKAKSPRLVPFCQYAIIIQPKRPILLYFSHMSLLKAKIVLVGLKMKEYLKLIQYELSQHFNALQLCYNTHFLFLSFSGQQGLFWPLKGSYVKSRAKLAFWVV